MQPNAPLGPREVFTLWAANLCAGIAGAVFGATSDNGSFQIVAFSGLTLFGGVFGVCFRASSGNTGFSAGITGGGGNDASSSVAFPVAV